MPRRAFRNTPAALLMAGAGIILVAAVLLSGGRASASVDCWYGEISLSSLPSLRPSGGVVPRSGEEIGCESQKQAEALAERPESLP